MCFSFRTLHQIYNTPQITIAESQERSFSFPSSVDAEFILSLEDIEQFITILHSTETLLCTAVAWSTSDEGTRHRLEVQRALFAMQASFNAELHNTLRGRDFALLAPFEDRTSVCVESYPRASSSNTSRSSTPAFNLPLGGSSVNPLLEVFPNPSADPEPHAAVRPLRSCCRTHRRKRVSSCRFCRRSRRQEYLSPTREADSFSSFSSPSPKRARWSPDSELSATLAHSASPARDFTITTPSANCRRSSLHPEDINMCDAESTSWQHIQHSVELRTRSSDCGPRNPRSATYTCPPSKNSFWAQIFAEFLPFL